MSARPTIHDPSASNPSPEESAGSTFEAALRAYRTGDMVLSRKMADMALVRDSGDVRWRLLLARLCHESGDRSLALSHLEAVLARDSRQADAWLQLGVVLDSDGQTEQAIARLRQAQAVLPTHIGVLNNLGVLLAKAGRNAEGRDILKLALSVEPRSHLTHFNLARLLKEGGYLEDALMHYRRAAELKPDLADAHHNLGNLLLDLDRAAEAMESFRMATRLRFGIGATGHRNPRLFSKTTSVKLRHDIEQFHYLRRLGILGATFEATIADYQDAWSALGNEAGMVNIPAGFRSRLASTYNRLLHWDPGERIQGPAVNPNLDHATIVADYRRQVPGMAWFDGFLTPEALAALRHFCLTSTIWTEFRYSNGYLGSFIDGGFCAPLLHQIASELAAAFPEIFGGHPLAKLWAFKYDSKLSGIPIHADFAAVNVNFWLTPDDANQHPSGGGLKIWDREAPPEWDFSDYNMNEPAIRQFLGTSGARMVNVPHRQNRAVMFNSDLFHETGDLNFRDGYENRRINVTMLFGRRANA